MIRFMRYRLIYLLISSCILIPGIYSLIRFGFKPSIDFTGGSLLELKLEKGVAKDKLEEITKRLQIELSSLQETQQGTVIFRTKPIDKNKAEELKDEIKKEIEAEKIEEIRFETVGPILGRELLKKTIIAVILAIIGILAYIAYAFKDMKYGVSAIVALAHDVFVLLGTFSLFSHFFGIEIDTLFVTAVLTTMSFSVHDTIVVFDRIRESQKKYQKGRIEDLADKALTETMVRSLNNSLTIVFMLLAIILLGGQTIRWFTVALLIGTIVGTYSSPFIATPILVTWIQKVKRT